LPAVTISTSFNYEIILIGLAITVIIQSIAASIICFWRTRRTVIEQLAICTAHETISKTCPNTTFNGHWYIIFIGTSVTVVVFSITQVVYF